MIGRIVAKKKKSEKVAGDEGAVQSIPRWKEHRVNKKKARMARSMLCNTVKNCFHKLAICVATFPGPLFSHVFPLNFQPRSLDDDLKVTVRAATTLDWQRVPFVLEAC